MKGKLVWILLGASLAANLFFAAGALYSFYGGEHRGWRAEVSVDDVAERLALSPAQRDGLQALRDQARNRPRPSREEREARRATFLAELAKPAFDRAGLEALMAERRVEFQARFLDRAEALHGSWRWPRSAASCAGCSAATGGRATVDGAGPRP
jgi:Spy/CpxP family protein refolding chaperone